MSPRFIRTLTSFRPNKDTRSEGFFWQLWNMRPIFPKKVDAFPILREYRWSCLGHVQISEMRNKMESARCRSRMTFCRELECFYALASKQDARLHEFSSPPRAGGRKVEILLWPVTGASLTPKGTWNPSRCDPREWKLWYLLDVECSWKWW